MAKYSSRYFGTDIFRMFSVNYKPVSKCPTHVTGMADSNELSLPDLNDFAGSAQYRVCIQGLNPCPSRWCVFKQKHLMLHVKQFTQL